jgi:putative nucleotidyltransferase with HDIG domain
MEKIWIITDKPSQVAAIRQQVEGIFDLEFLQLGRVRYIDPPPSLLLDLDFGNSSLLLNIKDWLSRKPKDGKAVFVVDHASRLQVVQARALGGTDILFRSFGRDELVRSFLGDPASLADETPTDSIKASPGVGKAFDALRSIFNSACLGARLDPVAITLAGEAVMRRMEVHGLASWIDTVRRHHGQTYQHCLIVTGVTVAFAQHLGLSRPDQLRLSFGAMLHDIGKARIPVSILEKVTPLTAPEISMLGKHPEYGLEALKNAPALNTELLDIVIHHHEYLDGSGYPHRLSGREISDPVRIVTICDVFGALLERRAYREPLDPQVAYRMLLDMGTKLDKDLLREFAFTKELRLNKAA